MSPLVINHRWLVIVNIITLLFEIWHQDHFCEAEDTNESSCFKDMLFITAENITENTTFPSEVIYHSESKIKLCFNIQANKTKAGCCHDGHFDCSTNVKQHGNDKYTLNVNLMSLIQYDVVVLRNPAWNFSYMPSHFYTSGFILQLHNCLKGGGKNIRLSQNDTQNVFQENMMKHGGYAQCMIDNGVYPKNVTCRPAGAGSSPGSSPVANATTPKRTETTAKTTAAATTVPTTTTPSQDDGQPEKSFTVNVSESLTNPKEAVNVMNNLTSLVDKMGNSSTAAIKIGNITGVIKKLSEQNLWFGVTESGDVKTLKEQNEMGLSIIIKIPKEASEMAVNRSSKFAAVLLFPEMTQSPSDEENSFFFNNEILGIEMGAKIFNLSETVDIQFNNVEKNGNNASCMSWDSEGNSSVWTTDGCQTVEANNSITCRCSHLTFFAILMSPIPTNISASDFYTLNQITEVGCGVSMFFLGVALFMHFLIRKNKASNATKILINLFIALFFLNFSFLIDKTIAELKNSAACVAMAAFLHYSMLATFTWFSMQAFHLYFSLQKVSADIRYYMAKVYITGWVTPAVFVIVLLGLKKYEIVVIHVDDGTSQDFCWMSDSAVHFGVNIGYYTIVFIFTVIIFVVTMVQIVHIGSKAATTQDDNATKAKLFSIVGLFFLLGISWAFAFFSYGSLLIPSYYIFTVLNSFQGFVLYLYYYYSSKIVPERKKVPQSINSTVIENVYAKSPYG